MTTKPPPKWQGSNLYPVSFTQRIGGHVLELDVPEGVWNPTPPSSRTLAEGGFDVRVVGETDGPFRDYYFEDEAFMREMASVPGCYEIRDGVHFERLIVFEARLRAGRVGE